MNNLFNYKKLPYDAKPLDINIESLYDSYPIFNNDYEALNAIKTINEPESKYFVGQLIYVKNPNRLKVYMITSDHSLTPVKFPPNIEKDKNKQIRIPPDIPEFKSIEEAQEAANTIGEDDSKYYFGQMIKVRHDWKTTTVYTIYSNKSLREVVHLDYDL